MPPCLPSVTVPGAVTLSGAAASLGFSLTPPAVSIPGLSLLCCSSPSIPIPLPGVALGGSLALPIAQLVEPAVDAILAFIAEVPLPCLKDPPPAGEI